mmetsp:Transcript_39852/g.118264  ORF Transcript_39852/g.118264 Transcript_39852/m.118264 type:complete len:264 (+) Transcript_39852:101-892(+)
MADEGSPPSSVAARADPGADIRDQSSSCEGSSSSSSEAAGRACGFGVGFAPPAPPIPPPIPPPPIPPGMPPPMPPPIMPAMLLKKALASVLETKPSPSTSMEANALSVSSLPLAPPPPACCAIAMSSSFDSFPSLSLSSMGKSISPIASPDGMPPAPGAGFFFFFSGCLASYLVMASCSVASARSASLSAPAGTSMSRSARISFSCRAVFIRTALASAAEAAAAASVATTSVNAVRILIERATGGGGRRWVAVGGWQSAPAPP